MQPACGSANAAGMQGHLDHLLLHLRGLPRVGILQATCPPASQATLPAAVTFLAFRGQARAHNSRPVAGGTLQPWRKHGIPSPSWSLSYSNRGDQSNSSETPSSRHGWSSRVR